jgi:hypothetical protein
MNRWRQRLAELCSDGNEGTAGLAECVHNVRNVQKPDPDPSFEHSEHSEQRAESVRGSVAPTRSEAEEELTAIVKRDGDAAGRVRFGLPEIPEEPLLLRDGRRLWRFRATEIPDDPTRKQAAALIDIAHWHGAVLVADGRELIVVEPWLSKLPREALCELRLCASGAIAELLDRARPRWQEAAR